MKPIRRVQKGVRDSQSHNPFGFGSEFPKRLGEMFSARVDSILRQLLQNADTSIFELTRCYTYADRDAFLEILNPRFFWGGFAFNQDVMRAMETDAITRRLDPFLHAREFITNEPTLLQSWETQRSQYHDFASDVAERMTSGLSDELGAHTRLAIMASFRMLDAGVTGRQTYAPSPALGGTESVAFVVATSRGENIPLRIGIVKHAEYAMSLKNSDYELLERLFSESDPDGSHFHKNPPVLEVLNRVSPLARLALMPNVKTQFIAEALRVGREVQKLETSSFLPEWESIETRLNVGHIPHLRPKFSQDWCKTKKIPPLWMDMAGIAPFENTKLDWAFDHFIKTFPEEFEFDDEKRGTLGLRMSWNTVLRPILSRAVEVKLLSLFKLVDPLEYNDEFARLKSEDVTKPAALQLMVKRGLEVLRKNPTQAGELLDTEPEPERKFLSYKQLS